MPAVVAGIALILRPGRLETVAARRQGREILRAAPDARAHAGQQRCAASGRLLLLRAVYWHTQQVGLYLAGNVGCREAAIDVEFGDGDAGLVADRFQYRAQLVADGLQQGACDVAAVRAQRHAQDGRARVMVVVRHIQAGERRDERDAARVGSAAGDGVEIRFAGQHAGLVDQPAHR